MTDLDDLRWMWASRLSDALVDWAGMHTPDDCIPAPGVLAPLTGAWLVARAARVLTDVEHTDPTEPMEAAIPFDGGYPSAREIVAHVDRALCVGEWPTDVPEDPRAAELLFSELWSAARSRDVGPLALHRELAQRWEIRDPRMLNYLSGLESAPFASYVDFMDVLLEQEESETARLLMFLWNKLGPEGSNAEAFAGMPFHLTELAASARTALRVEHSIKRWAPGWDVKLQEPAQAALGGVAAHREHLADLLGQFTAHEVEIVRSAVFGDD